MATAEDIKKLLDGRKIIDEYRAAKTDRSAKDWKPPSIPDLVKAIEALEFKGLDDFFLFDMKLSYQELADVVTIVSSSNATVLNPFCDNCADRLPAGCHEVMRLTGYDTKTTTCRDARASLDTQTGVQWAGSLSYKTGVTDSVLTAQKAKASTEGKATGAMCTLDDVILFWNQPGHFAPRCTMTVKLSREFDFDPFWELGKMSLPATEIPPLEDARDS